MKKLFIFLITIVGINLISITNVSAKDFYEGSYIDGIYMTKEKNGTRYYQKARFFNRASDNKFSYCIEPFAMFNENGSYTSTLNPYNLSSYQKQRIEQIAYFGYQYSGHEDLKWYAITQLMIWKEADPSGNIYFTNTLDGERVEKFTAEINEINSLIDNYNKLPSIASMQSIYTVVGKEVVLSDTNNVLNNYKSNSNNAVIKNNKLIFKSDDEKNMSVSLNRNTNKYGSIPIYFHSDSSQDMILVGDLSKSFNINFNVLKTNLKINKIDKDNKSNIPRGEAKLEGAIYQLYDKDMNELDKLTIDIDLTASLENLDFGKYYLKEIKPGIGYTLDDKIYEFEISKDNTNIELTLENKVIEKEITIHKSYTDGIICNSEANISFNIFDHNKKLFTTITTDQNGIAKTTLPFGRYIFKQLNTTEGYNYTDDFIIDVSDNEEVKKELYDYKIKVPNTSKDINYTLYLILFISLLYVKKIVSC